jgi:hypothetical protein
MNYFNQTWFAHLNPTSILEFETKHTKLFHHFQMYNQNKQIKMFYK